MTSLTRLTKKFLKQAAFSPDETIEYDRGQMIFYG
jgi:hypothetical protein